MEQGPAPSNTIGLTGIHATCVTLRDVGVLLRGPSGSGKSDLALRLIDAGAVLVSDDRVDVLVRGRDLVARPPPALAGLLEIRGIGIVTIPFAAETVVRLVVDLTEPNRIERLPEPESAELCGLCLPLVRLAPFEASAVAKIRLVSGVYANATWPERGDLP